MEGSKAVAMVETTMAVATTTTMVAKETVVAAMAAVAMAMVVADTVMAVMAAFAPIAIFAKFGGVTPSLTTTGSTRCSKVMISAWATPSPPTATRICGTWTQG
jgi:hypothetical protein